MQKNSGNFVTSNKSAFKPYIKNQQPANKYLSDIDEISKSMKGINLNDNREDFNKTKLSTQSAFTAFPKK